MEHQGLKNKNGRALSWPTLARAMLSALLAAGCTLAASQQAGPPPSTAKAAADKPRTIEWDELVPAGWDPLKDFKATDFGAMNDGDPRAAALLKRMREAWDQAPVNDALDGALVRLPGYVVPLEEGKDGAMKEFLLVPYFGACIHSPPPPANQIIHVLAGDAARKGLRSMDAVWISGRLEAFRGDSFMGVSGYRMRAPRIEAYVEKKTR